MAVNLTESRIPGGFTKENADLLGFATDILSNLCLVSYLPQIIRRGDPLDRIINRYVVFIDASQFNNNATFSYSWSIDYLTETGASLNSYSETDPEKLQGIYDFNSNDVGLNLDQLPAFKKLRVKCLVSQGGATTELVLEHQIAEPFEDITEFFIDNESGFLGTKGGNPHSTHKTAGFFRDHFQSVPQWNGAGFNIPMHLPLSIFYSRVLKSRKKKDVYHKINENYYQAINAGTLELYNREKNNLVGPCQVKPHFLAGSLGITNSGAIQEGVWEEEDVFNAYNSLNDNDKADVYNYARFPRSSFLVCALMLEDLLLDAQAIQCQNYLGSDAEKTVWSNVTPEELKYHPDLLANWMDEYTDGKQVEIQKIDYKRTVGKVLKHPWSNYIDQIIHFAYPDKALAPRILDAYFARKVVVEGEEGDLSVSFERLSESKLLYQEYIIVETKNLREQEMEVTIRTGDSVLTGIAGQALELVPGDDFYREIFTAKVGDTTAFDTEHGFGEYANLNDFADQVIIKIALRPNYETTYETWGQNIRNSAEQRANLELRVQPKDKGTYIFYGPEVAEEEPVNTAFTFLTEEETKFSVAYFDKTNHPRIKSALVMQKKVGAADPNNLTVEFERLERSVLGRRVYVLAETEHFQSGQAVQIFLRTGDNPLTGVEMQALPLMDGNVERKRFRTEKGNTDALRPRDGTNPPYSNLADFSEMALVKIDLRPASRVVFDDWAQSIQAGMARIAFLEIGVHVVQPSDHDLYVFYGEERFEEVASNSGGVYLHHTAISFVVENGTLYEVFNRQNPFVFFNPNIFIGKIENGFSSDLVTYFYHDIHDNVHEIYSCNLSAVRRRSNGRKLNNVLIGHEATTPAPAGGSAHTNYYYSNDNRLRAELHLYDDIVTDGNTYGIRGYRAANNDFNDLVELVRMPDTLNFIYPQAGNLIFRVNYTFSNTPRRYCNPTCFAAFVGILAETSLADVVCNGMCFGDATSYPSLEHPNGDSVDLQYFGRHAADQFNLDGVIVNRDQLMINALDAWGFANILVGTDQTWLVNNVDRHRSDHNSHIHAGNFDINLVQILNA